MKKKGFFRILAWGSVVAGATLGARKYLGKKRLIRSTTHSVDERRYVLLNGQEQYIHIQGKNVRNPIIVYLHGGPGGPDTVIMHEWSKYLTDEYTVVGWDQRGCGNTYYRNRKNDPNNETVTFPQALEDLDALVDYLRQRFKQEKVIVVGHSYGTLLGSQYALIHPEKVLHYVGVGQFVSVLTAVMKNYEAASVLAYSMRGNYWRMKRVYEKVMNDASFENVKELCNMSIPRFARPDCKKMILMGLKSPYLRLNSVRWQLKCMFNRGAQKRLTQRLNDYVFGINLMDGLLDYEMPVAFIHGSNDWINPFFCSEKYLDKLTAPKKEKMVIYRCNYAPQYDKPEKFAEILKGILKG